MPESNHFRLIWEKIGTPRQVLERIEDLESSLQGYKGVYLWTEEINGKIVANYIGKHQKCILNRNIEHLYYHLTLKNSLPSIYRENRKRLVVDWTRRTKKLKGDCEYIPMHKFLKDKVLTSQTQMEVGRYFEKITIYFCKLSERSNDEIDTIESFLIFNLQPLENDRKTKSFNNPKNMNITNQSTSFNESLNFESLIENTKNYLKDNKLDPRPNRNSLMKST